MHTRYLASKGIVARSNVRVAFRELAKATHPDKQQPSLRGSASSAHFVRILAAYQILADPRKRALYDAQLGAQEKRQRRKEELYQHYRKTEYTPKRRKADFDRGFDSSDADPSAGIHEPERQEFVDYRLSSPPSFRPKGQ